MECLLLEEDGERVSKEKSFIFYPEFAINQFLYNLMLSCSAIDNQEMCRVLNSINNQGIEFVYPKEMGYIVKGTRLPIGCLSTGERVFFCAELARQTRTHIYLYKGLKQLAPDVQGIFYREFVECKYVHLLFDDYGQMYMFMKRGGADVKISEEDVAL